MNDEIRLVFRKEIDDGDEARGVEIRTVDGGSRKVNDISHPRMRLADLPL